MELHFSSLRADTGDLLQELAQRNELSAFTLVGGTALALYYGHRESIDLDLFTTEEFSSEELKILLQEDFPVEELGQTRVRLNLLVKEVKTDLIYHPYPVLAPGNAYGEIKIASLKDICAMKLNAIAGRGAKKDFIDFYFLLKQFTLEEMLDLYLRKYPNTTELMALKSLVYFEDAEPEIMPRMIKHADWKNIKATITKEVEKLRPY